MPPKNQKKSRTEHLFKRCKHLWDRCECPWWGRVKGNRVSLEKWSRTTIESKEMAKKVLARMDAAVRNGTFDRIGERPEAITNTTLFGDFLDEWLKERAEARRLRSNSLHSYIRVFRTKFGNERLGILAARPAMWERWLNECQAAAKWSDATYARYVQFGRALFNWAKRRKMVPENPFDVFELSELVSTRDKRISETQIRNLVDACASLDEPPKSRLVKVTPELLIEVRRRVEAGELQKDVAASTGLSRPLVSQIINGRVWNVDAYRRTVGNEMRRRLVVALDLGLRQGEMLKIQVKHVDYTRWRLNLPATITKAKKFQRLPIESERLRSVFNERQALGPDAYVFGRENGSYVASFDKSWKRLFTLAGLPVGRKDGYVWHDLRHEFVSFLADDGAAVHDLRELARHSDVETTSRYLTSQEDRLRELLRRAEKRRA
jgi:integrase